MVQFNEISGGDGTKNYNNLKHISTCEFHNINSKYEKNDWGVAPPPQDPPCVISLFSADTLGHYQTRATQKPCNNHREQNNIMIESKAYEPDNEPTLKHN